MTRRVRTKPEPVTEAPVTVNVDSLEIPEGQRAYILRVIPPPDGLGGEAFCRECGASTPFYTAPLVTGHSALDHHPPLVWTTENELQEGMLPPRPTLAPGVQVVFAGRFR